MYSQLLMSTFGGAGRPSAAARPSGVSGSGVGSGACSTGGGVVSGRASTLTGADETTGGFCATGRGETELSSSSWLMISPLFGAAWAKVYRP